MDVTIKIKTTVGLNEGGTSLSVGDTVYWDYVNSDRNIQTTQGNPNLVGVVKSFTFTPGVDTTTPPLLNVVVILDDTYGSEPDLDDTQGKTFIMFQKQRSVNVSEVKGYYGEAKFVNDSALQCELFTASCDISESSK
jgi:hypothetical protein